VLSGNKAARALAEEDGLTGTKDKLHRALQLSHPNHAFTMVWGLFAFFVGKDHGQSKTGKWLCARTKQG
jgi:hypothetical protein